MRHLLSWSVTLLEVCFIVPAFVFLHSLDPDGCRAPDKGLDSDRADETRHYGSPFHKEANRHAAVSSRKAGLPLEVNSLIGALHMLAQLNEQRVIQASSQFWEQMLAMELSPMPFPAHFSADSGHLLGSVNLTGVWTGRIEVRLAKGLAYLATAAMMMQPIETVAEADALDAIKEIANMTAGVIKSSLPTPCAMTVPQSAVESEGFTSQPPAEDSLVVVLSHASGNLMVRVWEEECTQ